MAMHDRVVCGSISWWGPLLNAYSSDRQSSLRPFLVDPSSRATEWLKAHMKDSRLEVINQQVAASFSLSLSFFTWLFFSLSPHLFLPLLCLSTLLFLFIFLSVRCSPPLKKKFPNPPSTLLCFLQLSVVIPISGQAIRVFSPGTTNVQERPNCISI